MAIPILQNGSQRLPNLLLERAITNGRITTWLDVQHHHEAIAQRAVQPTALHAVAAHDRTVATGRTRPTPHRGAAGAAVAAAGPAAVQGRDGRERVRLSRTRLLKFSHSRQSARPLRREQRSNLTFATSSCATHGTTGRGQPKSCTICSWRRVSKFGSAKKTLASACR